MAHTHHNWHLFVQHVSVLNRRLSLRRRPPTDELNAFVDPDAYAQALSDIVDCMVADHTRHKTMAGIARSILKTAPDRFALAGLSMGGYIAYEIVRQAPERVERVIGELLWSLPRMGRGSALRA